jgi:hypothetical protein
VTAAAAWKLLESLHISRRDASALRQGSLSQDNALRQVLAGLLESDDCADVACDLDDVEGPILIIRSAPWPILRTLLEALAAKECARPISVLCHKRDADALAHLAQESNLALEPVFYPRFEPFVTSTLRRLLTSDAWTSTFVLDAAKHGQGQALEHVTTAVTSRMSYVWNGSRQAFRQRSLRERLGRERYALVRGLLRWRASLAAGDI